MQMRSKQVPRHQGDVALGLTVRLPGLDIGFINHLVLLAYLSVDRRTEQTMESLSLTLGIRHVLDHIAVLDDFNDTADEPLRSLGGVVDCDERVGTFGGCGRHLRVCSFDLVFVLLVVDLVWRELVVV